MGAVFTSEYWYGVQYSLVNIVWGAVFTIEYCMGTASTGGYGGTVFPGGGGGGVRYSLVNNVCGVRYSLGYRIHSDTSGRGNWLVEGVDIFTSFLATQPSS